MKERNPALHPLLKLKGDIADVFRYGQLLSVVAGCEHQIDNAMLNTIATPLMEAGKRLSVYYREAVTAAQEGIQ
ncbi:hypothetical protein [Methylobacterium sp. D48H]|jgi:hypothetical protein